MFRGFNQEPCRLFFYASIRFFFFPVSSGFPFARVFSLICGLCYATYFTALQCKVKRIKNCSSVYHICTYSFEQVTPFLPLLENPDENTFEPN